MALTTPDDSHETTPESIVKLDREFLDALSDWIESFYKNPVWGNAPRSSSPKNQRLTLLLKTVREENDINARDAEGNTLLHLVAGTNGMELWSLLLSHPDTDVNAQNKLGNTPLMRLIFKQENMGPMARVLLAHPAIDLEVRNNYEDEWATALVMARRYLQTAQKHKVDAEVQALVEIVGLIEAKQAEIAEKSKTTENVMGATGSMVAAIQDEGRPEVEWIVMGALDWVASEDAESPENREMIAILNELWEKLERALQSYEEQYGKEFGGISSLLTGIEYGWAEGVTPKTVDLYAVFSDLQQDSPFLRGLLSRFMEKDPEDQAAMLRFFELVHTYVTVGKDQKWLLKNPLKKILFNENSASWQDWISGIFNAFDQNASQMILLTQSIQAAEAPNTPLSWKSIRQIFPINPEIFEKDDKVWLTLFYAAYPDVTVMPELIKTDSHAKEQVDIHNELNKKYTFICAPEGTASEEGKKAAQNLRDSIQ